MNWTHVTGNMVIGVVRRNGVMRIKLLIALIGVLWMTVALASPAGAAQTTDASCEAVVQQALAALSQNCGGLDSNQVCYGFGAVNATFASGDHDFSEPGDRATLTELQSIQPQPLEPNVEQWGVAVMNVQANVPSGMEGPAVTFILLGDVTLENMVAPDAAMLPAEPVTVTSLVGANIRSAPSDTANVVGSVPPGTELQADGISEGGNWLRVMFEGRSAWVFRNLVGASAELDNLPVISDSSRTPMQDFVLRAGPDGAACDGMMSSLLVIQGPDSMTVDLTINGAEIRLGSTIALRITEDNHLQVIVLNGPVRLGTLTLPTGFTVSAPLSEDGLTLSGPWANARPLTEEELAALQLLELLSDDVLGYVITLPTQEDIQNSIVLFSRSSGGGQATTTGVAAGNVDCSRFRVTSPTDGLPFGVATFYWDAALGADNYRLNIYDANGALVGSYQTNSTNTALSVDTSGPAIGDGLAFSWEVQALYNNQVACTTARISGLRAAGALPAGGAGGDPDNPGSGSQWGN
jgi:hypothetical protein